MADAADHAWAIAVAAGNTPLPPHSPPLRHSEGGLNVAPATSSSPYTSTTETYTSETHNSRPPKQHP